MDKGREEIRKYVADEIDAALVSDWIKVYYQPIIRVINRSLCGLEALARWEDPDKGVILAEDIVPALEAAGQIYQLDLFVIHEVCRQMREQVEQGQPVVPVSFNLSWMDFQEESVFDAVEKILARFDIPRDMIRIEIQERALIEHRDLIHNELSRFQDEGYQVWVDDFGRGASLLSLLQEDPYNEIKIDMGFLSSFTNRSKMIIQSMVDTAKHIGLQTLAEGVETETQLDFLKEIGCEKVQGIYLCEPLPMAQVVERCELKGYEYETRGWQKYYDVIGHIDFTTDRSMALYEFDGENFHLIHANKQYYEVLHSAGASDQSVADDSINSPASPLMRQFRVFHTSIADGDAYKSMDYTVRGQYMRVWAKRIASCGDKMAYQIEIANLTQEQDFEKRDEMESVFRMMYLMFDSLYIADFEHNTIKHLMRSGFGELEEELGIDEMTIREAVLACERGRIHVADQKNYREWINPDTLVERMRESGNGQISEIFRTKETNGAYQWKVHRIMSLPGTENKQMLFSIMDTPLSHKDSLRRVAYSMGVVGDAAENEYTRLWMSLVDSNLAHIFWKDRERRFTGANRNFLDYYGISDISELIGKTDEDMNWHVNEDPYRNDEIDVLTKGITTVNRVGKCIIKGVVHTIMATKTPIYQEGKIVGLLGYFVDLDKYVPNDARSNQLQTIDEITGLMNTYGMLVTLTDYVGEWETARRPFAFIRISVRQYRSAMEAYGQDTANQMLVVIGDVLRTELKTDAACGRIHSANFNIFMQYERESEVERAMSRITTRLSEIHEVNGRAVTIRPEIRVEYANNISSMPELMQLLTKVEK